MTRLVFDIYPPPDDTPLGTRLVRLSAGDVAAGATPQGQQRTFYNHARPMGYGQITIDKDSSALTATNFAIGNYVIVRDLDLSEVSDSLNVLGGFFFEEGNFTLVSDDPKNLTFGGRSTISILERAVMPDTAESVFAGPQDIIDGYWRWGNDTYGGVMRRAIFEVNARTPEWLPMITADHLGVDNIWWDDEEDSNGDPWPAFVGEFSTQCGTTLLDLYRELYGFGVELEIDARTFDMYAFNPGGYGTDRTSASFGAGKVRLVAGVNIAADLQRRIQGRVRTTHLLVRTTDHPEGAVIESDDYTPGDPVYVRTYQTGDISGDPAGSAVINDRAQRNMDLRGLSEDGTRIPMSMPGDDEAAGVYTPGPNYSPGPTATTGHMWTGDLLTLDTGSHSWDYQDSSKTLEGIEYVCRDAGDWDVVLYFGPQQWLSNQSLIPVGGSLGQTLPLELCRPGSVGDTLRLYPSNSVSPLTYSDAAGWDAAGASHRQWKSTPDGSYTGTGSGATTSQGGDSDGRNIQLFSGTYGPLTTEEAAIFAAGGLVFNGRARVRMRSGIGISEAAQDGISQELVRILQSDGSVRGVALDLHTLTSSAGSTKWRANTTHQNRAFPPAAASATLAAVAGTVAGDYLQIDEGMRNFTDSGETSGGAWQRANDETDDLPEDETSTTDLNTWVDFVSESGVGADLPEDTVLQGLSSVGTSIRVARCDHKHAHGLLSNDETNYHELRHIAHYAVFGAGPPAATDDEGDGYTIGSHWIDSTSADPDNPDVYFLVDATEGAAVWTQLNGATGGGGAPTTADYLVGTAQAGLSAEIVVGTTPGGELGGTWASPTVDATHAGSNHLQPVRKNSTGSDFTRRRLNLIEGSNVTLTVADDAGNDEVDITIAATVPAQTPPTFLSIAKWGTD